MYKIGIDLGGTKVEGIALDHDNKEVYRRRMPNGKENGYEALLGNIKSIYDDIVEHIGKEPHKLGMGMPGSVSKTTGRVVGCQNIPCVGDKPILDDLIRTLGHNISIENDANCFALAEAVLGAGKGHNMVFGVILGTGCGGGLVIDGKVIGGKRDALGEWGHSTMNFNDGPDWHGTKGAVEAYISGSGVQDRYKERYGEEMTTSDIVYNYRNGAEKSCVIMDQFFENFGIAMANLIKFFDPDLIVMGGGLSNIDEIYTEGLEKVRKNCLNKELYTPIVKNEFGDSAGVFGAALCGVE